MTWKKAKLRRACGQEVLLAGISPVQGHCSEGEKGIGSCENRGGQERRYVSFVFTLSAVFCNEGEREAFQ